MEFKGLTSKQVEESRAKNGTNAIPAGYRSAYDSNGDL